MLKVALRTAGLAAAFISAAVQAQDYPSRAVRMLVPNAPGSSIDTMSRIVAAKLGDALGQPVQQHATHRRFADAARADEVGDTALRLHTAQQVRERSLVVLAQIDEPRIRGVREGALAETELLRVHR